MTFNGLAATATSWSAMKAPYRAHQKAAALAAPYRSLSPTSGVIETAVTITGTNFGSSQGTSTVVQRGSSDGDGVELECDEHNDDSAERGRRRGTWW